MTALIPQLLLSLLLCLPLAGQAAQLQLRAKTLRIAGQTLHQTSLDLQPQGFMRIAAAGLLVGQQPMAQNLALSCEQLTLRKGLLDCRQGQLALTWASTALTSRFDLSAKSRERLALKLQGQWQQHPLGATLQMDATQLLAEASAEQWPLAGLLALPPIAASLPKGMTASGHLGAHLQVKVDAQTQSLSAEASGQKLTASDASGRFASENLAAKALLRLYKEPGA
jgi:hypothetical protein